MLAGAVAGCGGDPLDRLAEGERGQVSRVFFGGELELEGGQTVRLAGVDVPGRGEPGAEEARAVLSRLLAGRKAALLYGGARRDGFGSASAHVRTAGSRRWAQGELLDAGFARVRTAASDRALAREMLRREARARTGRRGLWASPAWAVRLPAEVRPGFVLVEGRLGPVIRTRGELRLRLGAASDDLAVELPRRAAPEFSAAGTPLETLAGKLVRLRGVVRPAGSDLALQLDHPEQLELLAEPAG